MNQIVVNSFLNEVEKQANLVSSIGKNIGRLGASIAGGAVKATESVMKAPGRLVSGMREGAQSMMPATKEINSLRMNSPYSVAKDFTGKHVATPIKGNNVFSTNLGSKAPGSIAPENIKTTYMRGGKETNIAERRQQHMNFMKKNAPGTKIRKVGLGVAGGLGTAGLIAGGGAVYGGLTMEPGFSGSFAGEGPSSQGPVYGR